MGRATDEQAQKYYYRDADFDVVDALTARAQRLGLPNATLAYAWLLQRPGVSSLLVGASKPWQVEQAVQALDVTVSADDAAALEAPYQPRAVMGHA